MTKTESNQGIRISETVYYGFILYLPALLVILAIILTLLPTLLLLTKKNVNKLYSWLALKIPHDGFYEVNENQTQSVQSRIYPICAQDLLITSKHTKEFYRIYVSALSFHLYVLILISLLKLFPADLNYVTCDSYMTLFSNDAWYYCSVRRSTNVSLDISPATYCNNISRINDTFNNDIEAVLCSKYCFDHIKIIDVVTTFTVWLALLTKVHIGLLRLYRWIARKLSSSCVPISGIRCFIILQIYSIATISIPIVTLIVATFMYTRSAKGKPIIQAFYEEDGPIVLMIVWLIISFQIMLIVLAGYAYVTRVTVYDECLFNVHVKEPAAGINNAVHPLETV